MLVSDRFRDDRTGDTLRTCPHCCHHQVEWTGQALSRFLHVISCPVPLHILSISCSTAFTFSSCSIILYILIFLAPLRVLLLHCLYCLFLLHYTVQGTHSNFLLPCAYSCFTACTLSSCSIVCSLTFCSTAIISLPAQARILSFPASLHVPYM